jgi:hypothetical protein
MYIAPLRTVGTTANIFCRSSSLEYSTLQLLHRLGMDPSYSTPRLVWNARDIPEHIPYKSGLPKCIPPHPSRLAAPAIGTPLRHNRVKFDAFPEFCVFA